MSVISVQTKKFGDLGTILTAGDDSLLLIHDGTGVKTISTANFKKDLKEYMEGVNTILEQLTYDNAGAHNSIYRGKNLGTTVTEEQWEAISSGTFTDLYIGDYWVIGGVNWRIAAFDYYLNCGDTSFTKHHAVIVPDTCLYNTQMNTTNVTTGAYKGSAMYTANLTQANSNATSNGRASAGEWTDSTVDLMCEHMVYGSGIFSPVSDGSNVPNNYRVEKGQLPLFALEPSRICNRAAWWLRDVITAATFADVGSTGNANYDNASNSFGVRPAFCIG